ncbi:MAG: universal stress protein, partial [Thermodesulfobacteriota bacterium]
LLPVRKREIIGSSIQTIESIILKKWKSKTRLSVTLLSVAEQGMKVENSGFLKKLTPLFSKVELIKKVVESNKTADAILDESKKDYDLIVLGASKRIGDSSILFTPLVDYLVSLSPCPTMVVHGRSLEEGWAPNRILVPTNGTMSAKNAAEVAFSLSSSENSEVIILNVVVKDENPWRYETQRETVEHRLGISHQIVDELREIGESRGVLTMGDVRVGPDLETVILDVVDKEKIDIIILGTNIRAGSERLFLGPRVEKILANAPCPVIIFNS